MREILFRGKKTGFNEWVEGFISSPCKNTMYFMVEASTKTDWCVDAETVGQYTGLTDKNGKKIFEGDIVKIYLYEPKGLANYEIGCIRYDDTKARFVFCTEEGNYSIDNTNTFEVIGNIHDNPELLKGGAE